MVTHLKIDKRLYNVCADLYDPPIEAYERIPNSRG